MVTNESETLEYIKIDVLSVAGKNESDLTVVEFSFENKHNRPVRITGLGEQGALITIDKEGFSHSLINGNNIEFTVPNEAAKKHSLIFSGSASQVKQVRVWRETYDIDTKFRDASKNTGL
ncbi:hypothetical protein [Photobacterium halotolerans]|uniref:hypothetical protein n=1 Tax=Photobacterium halotolerans TaxID=265726 RepID=UPI0004864C53|nr:hypothetical protein [Photobacterium halotolerans]